MQRYEKEWRFYVFVLLLLIVALASKVAPPSIFWAVFASIVAVVVIEVARLAFVAASNEPDK